MLNKVYLVDVENVGFKPFDTKDNSIEIYYITPSDKGITEIPSNCKLISYRHNGCKDALDFILDTYLGYLIAKYQKSVEYIIVSNDKGYENVCGFWMEQGYKVTSSTLKSLRALSPKAYKGYTLVRDMTYNEAKQCSNIFRNYLVSANKDKTQLRNNLVHSLQKFGYINKEIDFIVDYLCTCTELEFGDIKEIFSVNIGG